MLKLIRDCAPWLHWKGGVAIGGILLLSFFIFGLEARVMALLGATPILAILLCAIPCAIPLLLLRRRSSTPAPAMRGTCRCGGAACADDPQSRGGASVGETR